MEAIEKTDGEFLDQIEELQIKCEKEVANTNHWSDQAKHFKE
jgi:hypothetical protein